MSAVEVGEPELANYPVGSTGEAPPEVDFAFDVKNATRTFPGFHLVCAPKRMDISPSQLPETSCGYATRMSSWVLALFVVVALVLAALAWRIFTRWRASGLESEPTRRLKAQRFDTTLGELRDVREALRPLAAAPAKKAASPPASE